ncbi:hypothetical protein GCM10027425_12300 [Alteromonas gracilis]
MKRRIIHVRIESSVCAFVRGHGSRELLTDLRGRPPVWSVTEKSWCVQERTARDVIALAESRGYDVEVGR